MLTSVVKYDEDIHENAFFTCLQNQHRKLFDRATNSRWLICVPRRDSLKTPSITKDDIEDHILAPLKDDQHYETVSGKRIYNDGGFLETSSDFPLCQRVSILFEEMFYNSNDESYVVLCIDHPLSISQDEVLSYASMQEHQRPPSTYDECLSLLWPEGVTSGSGRKLQESIDTKLEIFANSYDIMVNRNLVSIMDTAKLQFSHILNVCLKDSVLKRRTRYNASYMDNLKIAVETYMTHSLHRKLFASITSCMSTKDALLNKSTRNLSQIQLRDLSVQQHYSGNIPLARREISQLNCFSTPLGKLYCVRRVVQAILKKSTLTANSTMTTDDLLPILMFLIIKSQIANWFANLVYMKHFNFAKTSSADEHGFYIATIEGALEHILSGKLGELLSASDNLRAQQMLELSIKTSHFANNVSPIDRLFQHIHLGHVKEIETLLNENKVADIKAGGNLCHPLCSCDSCEVVQSMSQSDPSSVTVYSRDDKGLTVLHAAALAGQSSLVDILIKRGAVVNASDYMGSTPLHLAAQKGSQSFLLLLLGFQADPNLRDNDGNTALHIACAFGHEDCAKALIFSGNHGTPCDIDPCNDMGDTPLHLASKWGYAAIVVVLLENGAHQHVYNRRSETPYKMAANSRIQQILSEFIYLTPVMIDWPVEHSRSSRISFVETDVNSTSQPISNCILHPDSVTDINHQKKVMRLLKAVYGGDVELVKFYLGWQEDYDDDDADDLSHELCHPLCQCSKCAPVTKHVTTVSDGINVNCHRSSDHMTPLHMSVLSEKVEMVQCLLKHHAYVNCQNNKLQTPLHLAAMKSLTPILDLLIAARAKVDMRDMHGNTALHFACMHTHVHCVRSLLNAKANPNLCNSKGNSPLHRSVINQSSDVIDLLLTADADVQLKNKHGVSPLMLAEDSAICQKLLDYRHIKGNASITEQKQDKTATSDISTHEFFAAFEERNLVTLRRLGEAIRSFDRAQGLRQTHVKDSSSSRKLIPYDVEQALQRPVASQNQLYSEVSGLDPLHSSLQTSLTNHDQLQTSLTNQDQLQTSLTNHDSLLHF